MNDEIKKILENIKCPQLGYDEYGKWGALPLNVRMTLKRLCDYVVSCDDYITNLQQEIQKKDAYIKYLEEYNPKYYKGEKFYGDNREDYQQRIDKAIEYISSNCILSDEWEDIGFCQFIPRGSINYKPLSKKKVEYLLNILKGDSNE